MVVLLGFGQWFNSYLLWGYVVPIGGSFPKTHFSNFCDEVVDGNERPHPIPDMCVDKNKPPCANDAVGFEIRFIPIHGDVKA
jgi:hypothetical protein